jgi:hypothetical protein
MANIGIEILDAKKALKLSQEAEQSSGCDPKDIISVYPYVVLRDDPLDDDTIVSEGETASFKVAIQDMRGNQRKILPLPNEMVYINYSDGSDEWLKTDENGVAEFTAKVKGKTYFDVPAILLPRKRWFYVE